MKIHLQKAWYAVLLFSTVTVPVAMADSLSDQLRKDALQELSREYPEDGPFTRAQERSAQGGDIISYTFSSTGENGKENRYVRYSVRVSKTSNAGEIKGDILDKKICADHNEYSCK